MFKVDQTLFGGQNSPLEEQGNCFQACVATILQMPLEEAYSCVGTQGKEGEDWLSDFNDWLEQYGLSCIFVFNEPNPIKMTELRGMSIAEFTSATLNDGTRHVVVMLNHFEVFHDPNPNASELGELKGVYLFMPLKPYMAVRK